jgi:hypothetical protein
MKKVYFVIFLFSLFKCCLLQAQAENSIVITLDGFRWQEVFKGADPYLINDTRFVKDTAELKQAFWAATVEERRKKLLPFFWSVMAKEGQLHGNRDLGSKCNVLNPYNFSYPGYNELFTGYPDTAVNSNDKIPNRNENVFEFVKPSKRI